MTTRQRLDILLVNKKEKKIALLEITVSFEKDADSAHLRKASSYHDLIQDIKQRGWFEKCLLFEIGSRGHIRNRTKTYLFNILKRY